MKGLGFKVYRLGSVPVASPLHPDFPCISHNLLLLSELTVIGFRVFTVQGIRIYSVVYSLEHGNVFFGFLAPCHPEETEETTRPYQNA